MSWGIATGIIWLLIKVGSLGSKRPAWVYPWFRSANGNQDHVFFRRVREALGNRLHWNNLRWFKPILWSSIAVFGLLLMGEASFPMQFFLGFTLGYGLTAALAHAVGIVRRAHLPVATYAAQLVALSMKPSEAQALLLPLVDSPNTQLRLAAVAGLRELGTQKAEQTLQTLSKDKLHAVAVAAQCALDDLQKIWKRQVETLTVHTMERLTQEHKALFPKVGKTAWSQDRKNNLKELEEITEKMNEFVFAQLPLRRSFPHVYCKDCLSRAEKLRYESWEWVKCKRCHEAKGLATGVETVVGQIGADTEWNLSSGTLYISLWDDEKRMARAAEMDSLEIVGGKSIHYDWAVSAVVEQLHKQGLTGKKNIPVQLKGDPNLEPNSMHLLKTLVPKQEIIV